MCCPAPTIALFLFELWSNFAAEEPRRYADLVEHLERQWARGVQEAGVAAAAEATLPFVPLAKW